MQSLQKMKPIADEVTAKFDPAKQTLRIRFQRQIAENLEIRQPPL
jgi:hypothetical protein